MNFGLIAAGGIGTRFGGDIPKQFLILAKKPILVHSVEKFLKVSVINFICVGTPEIWIDYTKKVLNKYFKNHKDKIFVVQGGNTRNETIINLINFAEKNLSKGEKSNIAVTHDAARPFVTEKIIERTLQTAMNSECCTVGAKIFDTIGEFDIQGKIQKYLNREKLVSIQTPQAFDMEKFKQLYESLNGNEKKEITDCSGVFYARNKNVKILLNKDINLKITARSDYELAKKFFSKWIIYYAGIIKRSL